MTYQEKLVDEAMIDRLELKYPGAKAKVSKTSKYFKRNAIASILGTDRKIYELIKNTEEIKCDNLTYLDELVILFRKYVEVADVEKKTLGEVMTPITLVEEMLDTLPSDVWSNPNLKWLDPCAGVGTFPSIVVQRLMKGLEKFEKNPIKRYRHIIEEMMYVCELQPKNLFVYHCVFDKDDTNELNTYCGSFLDENFDKHMTDVWGVEKFDIVIGNPPYQTSNEGERSQPIWHKFVNKSFGLLIENGYLVMVHPDGWRSVDGMFKSTQTLMTSKEIIYLELHDTKDGVKTFGANTTYDFYCVRNKNNKGFKTKVKCVDGTLENVDLSKMKFIPNGRFLDFQKLFSTDDNDKINILDSNYNYAHRKPIMCEEKNNVNKYPCIYTTKKDGTFKVWYSSTNELGHFGLSKVIWSNGGASHPIIDKSGEYGLMEYSYAIVDEPVNLEKILQALLNPKFLELMTFSNGTTGVGLHRYNTKAISTFRKDFYKQFLND